MDDKFDNTKRVMPANMLHGKLPGSDSAVYFTEEIVAGKGDCGFIAIGYSREEVANLLFQANQEESETLWEEIYEAFQTKSIGRTDTFNDLYNAFQEPNLDDESYEAIRASIEDYCKQREVFEYYIRQYLNKLWLGYKSALLFAKFMGISVYVWKKDDKNNLTLMNSVVAPKENSVVVHMLMTGRYTHYNLLIKVDAPLQRENNQEHILSIQEVLFNPQDTNHLAFVERLSFLSTKEMDEIFAQPVKKVETRKGLGSLNRSFIVGSEFQARSEHGRELFNEISGLVLSLFPGLTVPLLNDELKQIVAKALTIGLPSKTTVKNTKEVGFTIGTKVFRPGKEEFTASKKEVKAIQEKDVKSPVVTVDNSAKTSNDKSIQRYENIHPMVNAVEASILTNVKKLGYIKFEKQENNLKLVREGGQYIDIAKDGSMKSQLSFGDDINQIVKETVSCAIAMIAIYHEIAKKYGKALAFPSGELELFIESDAKNLNEIKKLTKERLKEELAKSEFAWISDQFIFEGEKLNSTPTKTHKDSATSTALSQQEKLSMGESKKNPPDDFDALRKIREREANAMKKDDVNTENKNPSSNSVSSSSPTQKSPR